MLEFHTLDVFTQSPFGGNPLAVVLGADGLSTAQMQTIAREFNLSETIFVRPPADPAHTAEVRIFFPTAEIPFAGHPTVGCAILLAQMARGKGDWAEDIVLEEQAGLVPVRVVTSGEICSAEFVAPVIPHTHEGLATVPACAAALGLQEAAIGFGRHAPGVWAGGPAFLYIPVADLDALARARPSEPAWSALMAAAGIDSAYVYSAAPDGGYRARMFSPTGGIPVDPATGSASAILAAQLRSSGALAPGVNRVSLTQGVEMGRPSQIGLTVTCTDAGDIEEVRIKGTAVRISEGRIRVPE